MNQIGVYILCFICSLQVSLVWSSESCNNCTLSSDDYEILHSLYNATNGEQWSYAVNYSSSPWVFDGEILDDPCENDWYGVKCGILNTQHEVTCPPFRRECYVVQLSLGNSNLNGSLPHNFFDLHSLQDLNMTDNTIGGSIPTIDVNSAVVKIYLSNNQFDSSLPLDVFALPYLQVLELDYNFITGKLPIFENSSTALEILDLSNNQLTGGLPAAMGNLTSLKSLVLSSNNLEGSIPAGLFSRLTLLVYVNIAFNGLQGRALGFSKDTSELDYSLAALNISHNAISGPLPSFAFLKKLSYLGLSFNAFTSTVPSTYGELVNLQYFFIQNNELTGTLPTSLANLANLKVIVGCNNNFNGNIQDIFNPDLQRNLTAVDLSGNTLSGSIPSTVFNLPAIRTITLGKNCFSGSLPASLCNATTATALKLNAMAGLYGNTVNTTSQTNYFEACPSNFPNNRIGPKNKLLGITNLALRLTGEIPSCVFSLPNLQELYLAGNSLQGSISGELTSKLTELSLSYNHLTGTIPQSFQSHSQFQIVDLSFNQLTGCITGDFGTASKSNATVFLNNNFLSGSTPYAFNALQPNKINVLSGNVFSNVGFDYSLPPNDPSFKSYVYGSFQLDIAIYVLCGTVAVLTCLIGFAVYSIFPNMCGSGSDGEASYLVLKMRQLVGRDRAVLHQLLEWKSNSEFRQSSLSTALVGRPPAPFTFELQFCAEMLRRMRVSGIWIAGLIAVAGFIFYPAITLLHPVSNSHAVYYAWIVTLAYLQGNLVAGIVAAAVIIATGAAILQLIIRTIFVMDGHEFSRKEYKRFIQSQLRRDDDLIGRQALAAWARHALITFLVVLTNISVVLTINVIYVDYVANSYDYYVVIFLQVAISLFKLLWNSAVVPTAVRLLFGDKPMQSPFILRTRAVLFYINNVFLPCFATAVTDASCFVTMIFGNQDEASISAVFENCVSFNLYTGECTQTGTTTTSIVYIPGFIYNNQCASAMLTNYIPVYIYSYVFQLMFALAGYALLIYFVRVRDTPDWARRFIPLLLWPSDVASTAGVLANMEGIVSASLHHFIILLTFGLSGPALATVIGCTIVMGSLQWHVLFGRYMQQYEGPVTLPDVSVIGNPLGVWKGAHNVVWVAVFGCCLFYAFVLTDFIGGFNNGQYWVALLLVLAPIVMYLCLYCAERSFICIPVFEPRANSFFTARPSDLNLVTREDTMERGATDDKIGIGSWRSSQDSEGWKVLRESEMGAVKSPLRPSETHSAASSPPLSMSLIDHSGPSKRDQPAHRLSGIAGEDRSSHGSSNILMFGQAADEVSPETSAGSHGSRLIRQDLDEVGSVRLSSGPGPSSPSTETVQTETAQATVDAADDRERSREMSSICSNVSSRETLQF